MKAYRKSMYTIHAVRVPAGIKVYNYLEDVEYTTTEEKCIVLTGTMGEQWPVTFARLASTYTFSGGGRLTEDIIPEGMFKVRTIVGEDAKIVFAEMTTEQVEVATSWGEILHANRPGIPHGLGDYIVYADQSGQPDKNDRRVVNGAVFVRTYEPVKVD